MADTDTARALEVLQRVARDCKEPGTIALVALFAAAAELEKARDTPVELDIHDTETGDPDHPDDKPTHSSDWAHRDWDERVQAAEQKLWAALAAVTKGVLGDE